MNLVLVFIVTAIVLWKSIYTIRLMIKFLNEKNTMHTFMNIAVFIPYIMYFYFLKEAACGQLKSVIEEKSVLIFIFIILAVLNVFYDFKYNCISEKED